MVPLRRWPSGRARSHCFPLLPRGDWMGLVKMTCRLLSMKSVESWNTFWNVSIEMQMLHENKTLFFSGKGKLMLHAWDILVKCKLMVAILLIALLLNHQKISLARKCPLFLFPSILFSHDPHYEWLFCKALPCTIVLQLSVITKTVVLQWKQHKIVRTT